MQIWVRCIRSKNRLKSEKHDRTYSYNANEVYIIEDLDNIPILLVLWNLKCGYVVHFYIGMRRWLVSYSKSYPIHHVLNKGMLVTSSSNTPNMFTSYNTRGTIPNNVLCILKVKIIDDQDAVYTIHCQEQFPSCFICMCV